jgi:DNA-binding transcriptional MerR regulator
VSTCEVAVPADERCAGLAEYRLDDLARISGVSSRNIRAYRERGLLDPPRRQGRSAFYDDYHLSQLKTINQLLRKGFTSAHIAEFFERMREGHDLAAILGVQQAVQERDRDTRVAAVALALDPECDEAQRLLSSGLAEITDGAVTLTHPEIADIVRRSTDPMSGVRMILRVVESTTGTIDELSAVLVAAVEEAVTARYGAGYVPTSAEMDEVARLVNDYRDLGIAVVTHRLGRDLQRHMVSAVSDHTTVAERGRKATRT